MEGRRKGEREEGRDGREMREGGGKEIGNEGGREGRWYEGTKGGMGREAEEMKEEGRGGRMEGWKEGRKKGGRAQLYLFCCLFLCVLF